MKNDKNYMLLLRKDIYAILDGDIKFGSYNFPDGSSVEIGMPYLSGQDLCKISSHFGLSQLYTSLSRWQYLENLMRFCIDNDRCSDLLAYLFNKEQFSSTLCNYNFEEIDTAYNDIIKKVIHAINNHLYFSGYELSVISNKFIVKKINEKLEIEMPQIKLVDRDYIRSISSRAMNDIDNGDFDSAITKARTTLEETFCYVIEKRGESPATSGKLKELYKQVKNLYKMHTDSNADCRVKTLLSGLEKIITSISEMRNKSSDSHGVGSARINIEEHHARLAVNAAMTMADFILSVEQKVNKEK